MDLFLEILSLLALVAVIPAVWYGYDGIDKLKRHFRKAVAGKTLRLPCDDACAAYRQRTRKVVEDSKKALAKTNG